MTPHVLVVDDQADERGAIADLLHRHHYAVESAANGQEALDRLRQEASLPSAVVVDLNMPVMDGWEFLGHVAEDDHLRDLPIVIVSGAPVVRDAPLLPSNVAFVAKPLRPHAFVQVIADMLGDVALARAATLRDCAAISLEDQDTERYAAAGPPTPPTTG